jgi:hypothetical protein
MVRQTFVHGLLIVRLSILGFVVVGIASSTGAEKQARSGVSVTAQHDTRYYKRENVAKRRRYITNTKVTRWQDQRPQTALVMLVSKTVRIEQTPTTLVVRNYYPFPNTKRFVGIITSIAGGKVLLSVAAFGLSGLAVLLLPGTGIISAGTVGMLGSILLLGVVNGLALILGVRSLPELQQTLYPEVQLWTFDKELRTLIVSTQLSNRTYDRVSLRQIASYPLPISGAVQAISGYSGDDFWAQLTVCTASGQIKGLKHRRLISGNLKREAQQINRFLRDG